MTDSRDTRRKAEMLDKNMRELDRAIYEANLKIKKTQGAEKGYPVVSSFPTGVSDGFIVFHIMSRRLHMYDGATWISCGDVGAYYSAYQGIFYLRAFWPMNSFDVNGWFYDLSGQGRTLTNSGVGAGVLASGITYASLNGTTGFLTRADEASLDITTGLTFGCWILLNSFTTTQVFFSKFAGAGQRSYEIGYTANTGFFFQMSTDGTAIKSVTSSHSAPSSSAWFHVVARFNPSTSIDIYVNGVKTSNTTSIPATIFSSTAALGLGYRPDGAGSFWCGCKLSFVFISVVALPDAYINALYEEGVPLFT